MPPWRLALLWALVVAVFAFAAAYGFALYRT
jgi:hypothetical protein